MTGAGPIGIPRTHNPFGRDGVTIDGHDVAHYDTLPATLLDVLSANADRSPNGEAVVEVGGERLTHQQLWDRAARVAGGLKAGGLGRGDRVAVRLPAGIDWVLAFYGTIMAGGLPVAINTRWTTSEVDFVLDDAGVGVDLTPDGGLPDGEAFVVEGLTARDPAAFFYTSGTTGHPKGVPTTHEAFVTNAENMARSIGLTVATGGTDVRTLISVPLFHVTGCNSQLLTAAHLGGTSVIMATLDPARLLAVLAEERISFMVTVPAVYALLLRRPDFASTDLSTVRWVGYGGAPIAPSLVRSLKNAFPDAAVFNGYGMTETASLLTVLPHREAVDHADSVGYAVPSVDLGVLPIGDDPGVGELVARGANVTAGYWHRPEATAETVVDGWLHTGDVVRVDAEGRIHVIDRIKDIINRGGENVSSVEVEAALLSAPGVADAAVLAVPDEVMGEKVGAVVFGDGADLDIESILAHCAGRLAAFKVPQYVSVADRALPRNAGGKLLKAQLRDAVE